ncbi:MAG: hypothetical protein NQU41_05390 [Candidatus Methanosuratincola sp.]|jgi:hypothetical protein|uniref:Uncharacterized protein n=1 Tax=Candidatus Methanosuratincola petrocarbonis (ex Vanwonterghem et al. 2016) TaxID=1867261 RepID=A0A7J3UY71_9CREN|nr:hypothetical protein [Candidatus Methanosuratincola sp.]
MVNVTSVSLSQISGERLMDLEGGISNLQVMTNISITKITQSRGMLEVAFVFAVNYNPAVANLILKGVARVSGDEKELEEVKKNFEDRKVLPPIVLQSISNISFIEGIFLARSLNIPPPIPLPTIQQQEATKGKSPSYIA